MSEGRRVPLTCLVHQPQGVKSQLFRAFLSDSSRTWLGFQGECLYLSTSWSSKRIATNKAVVVAKSRREVGCRKINSRAIPHSIWYLLVLLFIDIYVWLWKNPHYWNLRLFVNVNHLGQLECPLHATLTRDPCVWPLHLIFACGFYTGPLPATFA